ncbi:MAG: two pore domain potassium channel family protein [Microvirga sp.]|jgi:voltage-gated potassium channel|nr:two pore domain potassium channel family protein [Microvirga sp.]MDF2970859.1 two pore domain potassium channel family protein [Microvirga sp.]
MKPSLRTGLQSLYYGESEVARRFRYGLIVFDVAILGVFLIASVAREQWWMVPLDLFVALVLSVEFAARLYVEPNRRAFLFSFTTLTDLLVIGSLLLPAFVDNLAFLRIARAVRLLRSFHLLRDLRADSFWFRCHEDVIQRTLNLGVFIFVVTSAVYVTQNDINPDIGTYIDALYFTITTLTTTGFGDITLKGPGGRLLAVIIMVIGVGLFLRLLQAIFRPSKVHFECPDCGLMLHEADAVHCKHCGRVLHIKTEGAV